MKLIVCLVVLSLIFVFSSNGIVGSTADEVPTGHAVLEQLQRSPSSPPGWWTWDVWAEWLRPPRRGGRRWRKLYRLLRKFWRGYRRRIAGWRRLRREWQELMAGASSVTSSAQDARSALPEQGACPLAAPQVSPQETVVTVTAERPADEPSPPASRGPGRPRTLPTNHVCCPHEACTSYGILGPHPGHDIVGNGAYTTPRSSSA